MRPPSRLAAAVLASAAVASAGAREPWRAPPATRVVAPLADPAVVPGIGRCTSDGICVVTDASGTRPAAPIALAP